MIILLLNIYIVLVAGILLWNKSANKGSDIEEKIFH